MHRMKQLLRDSLTLRDYDGQVAEAMAMVRALNRMTKAGMPESAYCLENPASYRVVRAKFIYSTKLLRIRRQKLRPQSVTSRIQPGSDVIVCAEMDEQWDTSALNRASAGCFTRMTGPEDGCCTPHSVNALMAIAGVL